MTVLRRLILWLILLATCGQVIAGEQPNDLHIGILAHSPEESVHAQWEGILAAISSHFPDYRLQLHVHNYTSLNEAVARQELDFLLTQPAQYILLSRRNGLSAPLATMVRSEVGEPVNSFGGVIVTRADNTRIWRLSDLERQRIATVSKRSLGGWMMQMNELSEQGVRLSSATPIIETEMPHDRVVERVLSGEADAGFVRSGVIEMMIRDGRLGKDELRVIHPYHLEDYPYKLSTRVYPEWPLIALPHVSNTLNNRMAAALFSLPLGSPILAEAGLYGFSTPMNYGPVEELLRSQRQPPFDAIPDFTAEDVWHRYRLPISVALVMGLSILALLVMLLFSRSRLKRIQYALQERVKEAECLGDVVQILRRDDLPLNDVLHACCQRIPFGWQHPQDTHLRIRVGELEICSEAYVDGAACLSTSVALPGREDARIDIQLSASRHQNGKSVFLPEEQQLLHAIATQLAQALQHREDQAMLVASEERYRAMVNANPDILFRHDEHGRYLDFHASDTSQLLRPPETFLGHTIREVMPPDLAEQSMNSIGHTLKTGEISVLEYQLVLPEGMCHYELRISRINEHEVLAIARDVSSRYRIEAELKRSNSELEQFAYAVSHDMRQPLRMISGHLGILKRRLIERLDADELESLNFAVDGAKRMDAMIISLLDYSRVGRKTDPVADIPSRVALDEAMAFLEPTINEHHATITVEGDWPNIHASRDEMTRLLQNLIGNGLKYRRPGQAPHLRIHTEVRQEYWHVEVCDNGIGVEPSQQDRLFKVFSRLHTRDAYEGTGIGLALCRKIVEHHHGRIGVHSDGQDMGSCFWFEIPLESDK